MESTMVATAKLPPKPQPTWKQELPEGYHGAPLIKRKEVREYVKAWWQDCLHHGFQLDPSKYDGMVEGFDYGGKGLWKDWFNTHALHASFLHWCEDMKIDRSDVYQMNLIQFMLYFSRLDKVHVRKKMRVLLRNKSDPRLNYRNFHKVVYFDILPAHREAFFR